MDMRRERRKFTAKFKTKVVLEALKEHNIQISMDGKGRAIDNVFIERLWRSVKWEHVYIKPASGRIERYKGLNQYFEFNNQKRKHQSLEYQTPQQVFDLKVEAA